MEGEENAARSKALLLTLRIWNVNDDGRAPQWRVRLQNVRSGEVRYSGYGNALLHLLDEILSEFHPEEKE
jgi:hypothetical protein